uniref:Uncharacterized protein n=1 Tax=Nelumbo nucifera TaxID=4432 RepID=A0A822XS55_NELNU|nr:TPA_asm: hypothetical protein HUJ06_024630 [Nelumbo nucifera]
MTVEDGISSEILKATSEIARSLLDMYSGTPWNLSFSLQITMVFGRISQRVSNL